MPDEEFPVLKRHKLSYLPNLRVDKSVLRRPFASGCSMTNCNADCCKQGVLVDPAEKENILKHADLIKRFLEPHQEKDPAKWFEKQEYIDTDYPSGKCVGTVATDSGCVFLDSRGMCTLQKAATESGLDKFALKPVFCVAYPVTIESSVLRFQEPEFTHRKECCSTVENGSLTVFDVCRDELEFLLGKEGVEELEQMRYKLLT